MMGDNIAALMKASANPAKTPVSAPKAAASGPDQIALQIRQNALEYKVRALVESLQSQYRQYHVVGD
jgi:cell division septation protein DedD